MVFFHNVCCEPAVAIPAVSADMKAQKLISESEELARDASEEVLRLTVLLHGVLVNSRASSIFINTNENLESFSFILDWERP
ncbi:hypothetical protein CEXT_563611 [Caerostris extrusa]|uniref:Uncharacterized protein n=1 Tax=Caerostris extrusa TaxID=172846 RepID=A0AAV4XRG2_CAEEX|nr:hypothetical protein CEXT_563611 [Caerostris extrusa]